MRLLTTSLLLLFPVATSLKCISFYGLETPLKDFVCSWANSPEYYVSKLKDIGFDSIRIPWSIDNLVGSNDFRKADEIVDLATKYDMEIILDCHRVSNSHQEYSPISEGLSMEAFIQSWFTVLDRYKDSTSVTGIDIWNEYQGSDALFYNNFLKTVIASIEERYPNRYQYYAGCLNWGNQCALLDLSGTPTYNRTTYSLHKYPFSSGSNYKDDWDFSINSHGEKVAVLEFGFKSQDTDWARQFVHYLKEKKIEDTCFWTIAHSRDTDGLFEDDCITINWNKVAILKTLWSSDKRCLLRGNK